MRTFLLLLCVVPLAAVSGYFIHGVFKYTRMISSIFMSLVYTPEEESPEPSGQAQPVTILDSSDREIEALYAGPQDAAQIAVFFHESGSDKRSWNKYAGFLPGLGYGVLSFDLSSQTDGPDKNPLSQWPTQRDVERALTVLRWTKKAFRPQAKLVLFGVSNGADIALAASAREPRVRAVVTDGLFSMKEIFRAYIRRWAPVLVKPNPWGERFPEWLVSLFAGLGFWYSQKRVGQNFVDTERLLRGRHVPVFFVYGENDDYVSAEHREFLARLGGSRSRDERLVVPKARHNEAVVMARTVYEKEIETFLKRSVLC